jgi:hypothetical protein
VRSGICKRDGAGADVHRRPDERARADPVPSEPLGEPGREGADLGGVVEPGATLKNRLGGDSSGKTYAYRKHNRVHRIPGPPGSIAASNLFKPLCRLGLVVRNHPDTESDGAVHD